MTNAINFEMRETILKELKVMIPYKELEYRNQIVAGIIASGKKDKISADWIRKAFFRDIEDGFITYEQAVAVRVEYEKAIEKIKEMY